MSLDYVHLFIHRYDSDGNSSLNVISGEMNFKDGTEPSQFANPLYDRASISTNGGNFITLSACLKP